MKAKILFILFLCLLFTASISAQITFYSCTGSAVLSITNPVNSGVYNMTVSQSSYPLQIAVSYYPGATIAQRRFKFTNGSFNYNMYYTKTYAYDSGEFPAVSASAGSHTWTVTSYWLNEGSGNWVEETSTSITFIVQPTLTVNNSFGGGSVIVNGTTQTSGYSFNPTPSSTVNLTAIDNQTYGNYVRVFNSWSLSDGSASSAVTTSVSSPTTSHQTCTAYFLKKFNVTLAASYGSGYMTYNNVSVSIPGVVNLLENGSATLTASSSVDKDSMISVFSSWSDGSTSRSRTISDLSDHISLTANYTINRPSNSYKNMNYSSTVGQPITITWNEHPNTGVTAYQVWRRIKDVQANTLLATVSRGTTSYTDTECTLTSGYSDNLIYYDIRAYYSPNGTYADADYVAVFGDYTAGGGDASIASSGNSTKAASASLSVLPTEYTMANYPNPFNPTTVIKYTMPEAGEVVLKVYNMIGQEVATLVNGTMSAGSHTVNFNAKGLPTGIYIARLQTGAKVVSSKLQLVK